VVRSVRAGRRELYAAVGTEQVVATMAMFFVVTRRRCCCWFDVFRLYVNFVDLVVVVCVYIRGRRRRLVAGMSASNMAAQSRALIRRVVTFSTSQWRLLPVPPGGTVAVTVFVQWRRAYVVNDVIVLAGNFDCCRRFINRASFAMILRVIYNISTRYSLIIMDI